jgi:hypothetical protein
MDNDKVTPAGNDVDAVAVVQSASVVRSREGGRQYQVEVSCEL